MKTILLSIFILGILSSWVADSGTNNSSNGTLAGLVTFKDLNEVTTRADAGGKVYAISEADVKSSQYREIEDIIDNFRRNKSFYSLSRYNTLDLSKIIKLREQFDTRSESAHNYINGFIKLPAITRTSTNAEGQFSLRVKPGRYYLLVFSGNVKSNNRVESEGNVELRIVDVPSMVDSFQNVSFEKGDNMLMLLLTARTQEGC
jgi:hypothetical protein